MLLVTEVRMKSTKLELLARTLQTTIGRHECWNLHLLPNGFVARSSVR